MSFYLSIVLRARERTPTPCSSVVFNLGLTFESFKELGVRHLEICHQMQIFANVDYFGHLI
jgi:hypothetical protein